MNRVLTRIALLPWGDVIEDFLDGIGVSFEQFASRMTGGWLFGYVQALGREGVQTSIICFSNSVDRIVRSTHTSTGAELVAIPAPGIYKALRRRMKDPYGWSVQAMFGDLGDVSLTRRLTRHAIPYLATPLLALAREIRRSGCDAILCQEYESPRFDAAILIGELLRIPVFATFQGGTWHRSRIEGHVRTRTLGRCAGLIVGSSAEAVRVREQYGVPADRIVRIANPVDLSDWWRGSRDVRRELGIPETSRVVIWHGRVDIRRKGLDLLIEAWRRISTRRPQRDALLWLVGSGASDAELEREIDRLPRSSIRWTRQYLLDREEMRRYLSAADIYVLPSRHEGFPVALLEAMACGLPAVAASAPGVADILDAGGQSGGVIVPLDDAEALAASLERMLDDAALTERMGVQARTRVEQAFSLSAVGAQLREFLSAPAVAV
ncbi:MAG TPA: glycosyltransferase family 4 protein [Vicinamibacterales bacterium]